jgi:hypothetical protein
MRSHPFATRVAAVIGATLLLTSLLGGTTLAKPPLYGGGAPNTPDFVSYGQLVRFDVTWTNLSGSNLPTVFTKAVTPTGASLVDVVSGPSQGTCTDVPAELNCAFGTVMAGDSVSFAAVYRVPSSGSNTFSVRFNFTAQGATGSDTPGKSRGDDMPVNGTVTLVPSTSNQAGSYILGDVTTVANNQALTKRGNPQSAKLDFTGSTEDNFGATVSEAASTTCATNVTSCYGDLVIMHVKGGADVTGGFLVTVGYESVPGSAQGGFLHWTADDATGTPEVIDQTCDETDGVSPCIFDTFKTNGSTFYVIQLDSNGAMRGF